MSTQVPTASPDTTAQAFLKDLRAQTALAHDRLEAHPLSKSIMRQNITAANYRRYLQVMQRVVEGLECVLNPALESLLPDLAIRSKQDWLSSDLALGSVKVNPYPPALFSVDGRDAYYALGAFYVLEGSTLGGRVILKSLPALLGVGTRYFEGYGAGTGRMWQSFLVSLCDAANAGAAVQQSITRGAIDTFVAISRYFNTCLAHEASGHS